MRELEVATTKLSPAEEEIKLTVVDRWSEVVVVWTSLVAVVS
jgi:hypothetical protein